MLRVLRFVLCIVCACAAFAHAQPWTPVSIPDGRAFVVGAGNFPVILAVQSDGPGVRSADGGLTWEPLDMAGERPVGFLASPTVPGVFYGFSTPPWRSVLPRPHALYRSNDAGRTWARVTASIQSAEGAVIGNIAVGASPDLLYGSRIAATDCFTGLCSYGAVEGYVSTDGGRNWQRRDPPGGEYHATHPSASDPRVAYATQHLYRWQLFRTADQGVTWERVLDAQRFFDDPEVVTDRVDASTLYVRFGNGPEIRASEDGGRTWRTTSTLPPGGWRHLVADPLQAGRLYAIGDFGEIFESRDRARSWHFVAPGAGVAITSRRRYEPPQIDNNLPMIAIENGRRVIYARTTAGPQRIVLPLALGSALWWNPAQSGWGLSLSQHPSGQLFGVWFTYDAQGDPTWLVMPGGTWTDASTFTATIFAMRGPAYFDGPFDPARVTGSGVGRATLAFADADHAVFRYRLDDGTAGESPITRQLFGPPADVTLLDYADLWWNPAESGWGIAVAQQYASAFAVWFVYGADGRPTWIVMPNAVYGERTAGGEATRGFHGDLFVTRGPPSGEPFDPARVTVTPVGRATLRFDNLRDDGGELVYEAFGRNATRPLRRQPF